MSASPIDESPKSLETMAAALTRAPRFPGKQPEGELLAERPAGTFYSLELRLIDRGDAGVRYQISMVNVAPNGERRHTGSSLLVSPKALPALAGVVAAALRAELADVPGALPDAGR